MISSDIFRGVLQALVGVGVFWTPNLEGTVTREKCIVRGLEWSVETRLEHLSQLLFFPCNKSEDSHDITELLYHNKFWEGRGTWICDRKVFEYIEKARLRSIVDILD